MSDMYERLKTYIYKITKGLVSIKEEHSEEIARLVTMPRAYAKLSKWNAQTGLYDHLYTETCSDKDVMYISDKYKAKPKVEFFAKWELFSSEGILIITVYTTSHVLNYLLL